MKKNDRKKRNIKKETGVIVAIIVAVVMIGAAIGGAIASHKPAGTDPATTVDPYYSGAIDLLTDPETTEAPATTKAPETETSPSEGTAVDPSQETTEPAPTESETEGGGHTPTLPPVNPTRPPATTEAETVPTTLPLPEISFPYTIEGSEVVIEKLSTYNGYYIEDGKDESVSGVAAIVLTNKGSDATFVGVGISQAGGALAFSGSQIPAGATVIILEQNKAAYDGNPCYSCTASVNRVDHFNMEEDKIRIQPEADGTFTVFNLTEETFPRVRIQFKNYLPDEDVYVGGITYNLTLTDIEGGEEVNVNSGHYDPRYTRFVTVAIEEEP
ncbi:MAG: hypothetical protein IJL66_03140 [Lachnospiraceae bacterium]|nr:hypothetical protein [Lachnospiraceae bacterium]